jgi:hypothetical protein
MFLNRFRLFVALLAPIALLALATPSRANSIGSASGTVTCTSYSLSFNLLDLDYYNTYTIAYTVTLTPTGAGSPVVISSSFPLSFPMSAGQSFSYTASATGSVTGTVTGYTISGSATFTSSDGSTNTVPISFSSSTVTCKTTTGGGCPATFGYWKNHAFPSGVVTNGLTIGGVTYTAAELLGVLKTPDAGGNAVITLGHQLIAALLNESAGATDNPIADAAITSAQSLLETNSLNLQTSDIHSGTTLGGELLVPAGILNSYNSSNFNSCSEGSGLDIS